VSRVALVTGSTGGIGAGIAQRLAADGFHVIVSGRRPEKGESVASAIRAAGGEASFVRADIGRAEDCKRLVDAAAERYGRLDVLVNNAGVFPILSIEETTAEEWDKVYAVNVRGVFLCVQAALSHLRESGGGNIVNIGSTTPFRAGRDRVAYATSKGALLTMTRVLARALLEDRIRVNWVTVGWVPTEGEIALRDEHSEGRPGREFLEEVGAKAPLGRLETAGDIAAGVAYLVSDEAAHVTACELNVSGGLWIG
jgi:NAD(P)-dependent dehydrogenase (short-subunit alcohol dehydrogenase family)